MASLCDVTRHTCNFHTCWGGSLVSHMQSSFPSKGKAQDRPLQASCTWGAGFMESTRNFSTTMSPARPSFLEKISCGSSIFHLEPQEYMNDHGHDANEDHSPLFMPNYQYNHTHTHTSHLLTHFPSSPPRKRKQKSWPLQRFAAMTAHWSHRFSSHADPGSSPVAPTEQTHRDVGCLQLPTLAEAWWSPAPSRTSRSRPELTADTNDEDTKSSPTLVGGKLQNTLLSTAHLGSSQLFYNILSSELTLR